MNTPDRSPLTPVAGAPVAGARTIASALALAAGALCAACAPTVGAAARGQSVAPRASASPRAERRVATRIEELLVGRVAGVQVLEYGDVVAVRVRGGAALGGEPLVVLDGHPIPGGGRALAALNPADVERIDVLKDVASTAVYGARGTNGVLVVTTRRGRAAR